MKRTAGTILVLAALGGCNPARPPSVPANGRARAAEARERAGRAPRPLPDLAAATRLEGGIPAAAPDPNIRLTAATGGLADVIHSALHEHQQSAAAPKPAAKPAPAPKPAPLPKTLVGDAGARPAGKVRLFNSDLIIINYEAKANGPGVDLWYRQDGQEWHKADTKPRQQSPFVVKVNKEGKYGFTLTSYNADGSPKPPPNPGDEPQMWVEVDMTRPTVHLLAIEAGAGPHPRHWQIFWKAEDKNLGPRPITIEIAEQSTGPWTPIAPRLANTGRYEWKVPPVLPAAFFVRVQAADRAGNVGIAMTPHLVRLDGTQPDVAITSVEAADPVYQADNRSGAGASEARTVQQVQFNHMEDDPSVEVLRDRNGKPIDILMKLRAPVKKGQSPKTK